MLGRVAGRGVVAVSVAITVVIRTRVEDSLATVLTVEHISDKRRRVHDRIDDVVVGDDTERATDTGRSRCRRTRGVPEVVVTLGRDRQQMGVSLARGDGGRDTLRERQRARVASLRDFLRVGVPHDHLCAGTGIALHVELELVSFRCDRARGVRPGNSDRAAVRARNRRVDAGSGRAAVRCLDVAVVARLGRVSARTVRNGVDRAAIAVIAVQRRRLDAGPVGAAIRTCDGTAATDHALPVLADVARSLKNVAVAGRVDIAVDVVRALDHVIDTLPGAGAELPVGAVDVGHALGLTRALVATEVAVFDEIVIIRHALPVLAELGLLRGDLAIEAHPLRTAVGVRLATHGGGHIRTAERLGHGLAAGDDLAAIVIQRNGARLAHGARRAGRSCFALRTTWAAGTAGTSGAISTVGHVGLGVVAALDDHTALGGDRRARCTVLTVRAGSASSAVGAAAVLDSGVTILIGIFGRGVKDPISVEIPTVQTVDPVAAGGRRIGGVRRRIVRTAEATGHDGERNHDNAHGEAGRSHQCLHVNSFADPQDQLSRCRQKPPGPA